MERITVLPGQVWADCDSRCRGRTVLIERVEDIYAYGVVLTSAEGAIVDNRGRKVRLAIQRMRPTSSGWRLVPDPEGS
jgi:hypoxanthine-guanine phosphoribosyltransferase